MITVQLSAAVAVLGHNSGYSANPYDNGPSGHIENKLAEASPGSDSTHRLSVGNLSSSDLSAGKENIPYSGNQKVVPVEKEEGA
ncbi:hypothetical protein U1Q18_025561 [Sarracenia purpurea var. burkii]